MATFTQKRQYEPRTVSVNGIRYNKKNVIDHLAFEKDVINKMKATELARKHGVPYALANKLKNSYLDKFFQRALEEVYEEDSPKNDDDNIDDIGNIESDPIVLL
jgi:hypothetical protein